MELTPQVMKGQLREEGFGEKGLFPSWVQPPGRGSNWMWRIVMKTHAWLWYLPADLWVSILLLSLSLSVLTWKMGPPYFRMLLEVYEIIQREFNAWCLVHDGCLKNVNSFPQTLPHHCPFHWMLKTWGKRMNAVAFRECEYLDISFIILFLLILQLYFWGPRA